MRAISAIDVALWDIKGKALGQPVYKLLGGYRDRVPTYLGALPPWKSSIGMRRLASTEGPVDEVPPRCRPTVAGEIARLETMRDAVGPDVDLMIATRDGT